MSTIARTKGKGQSEKRVEPDARTGVKVGTADPSLSSIAPDRQTRPATSAVKFTEAVEEANDLSQAYWDLHHEFEEIKDHADANGGPPKLLSAIRAVGDPDVGIEHWPDVRDLIDVLRVFWHLPEPERMRIFNGWRKMPAEARDTRADVEKAATDHSPLSVLTLGAGNPSMPMFTDFEEIAGPRVYDVRLHVRVGTTQARALAALDEFRKMIETHWGELVTEGKVCRGK
jgi:hypothetical protein